MAALQAFLEAHSYSGGLRHTPYLNGAPRPTWAPSADSVGWRDEFEMDGGDVVVEFHQRQGPAGPVSWLAVYRTSVDRQFGDRRNHAGMGVWLPDERVADPRNLLSALEQLSRALAGDPRPEALADKVAEFTAERYLPHLLIPADRLPHDWRGLPASATALTETAFRFVSAASFETALGPLVEEIARCSLDWTGQQTAPRMLILISSRPAAPSDRAFLEPRPIGSFLADLLERLPHAFDEERRALTEAQGSLAQSRTQWEEERRTQEHAWAAERRQLHDSWEAERRTQQEALDRERSEARLLDGQPPTLEGIAMRLNAISKQLASMDAAQKAPMPAISLRPSAAAPQPFSSLPPDAGGQGRRKLAEPARMTEVGAEHWMWFAAGILAAAAVALVAALIWRFAG